MASLRFLVCASAALFAAASAGEVDPLHFVNCPEGYLFNHLRCYQDGGPHISLCELGTTYDYVTGGCRVVACPPGEYYHWSTSRCVPGICPEGFDYNYRDLLCITLHGPGLHECPLLGQELDVDGLCYCPPDHQYATVGDQVRCVPVCTVPLTHYDSAKGICSCPAGMDLEMFAGGTVCMVPCGGGSYRDKTSECVCPEGKVWDLLTTSCILQQPCTGGICPCPHGYVWANGNCAILGHPVYPILPIRPVYITPGLGGKCKFGYRKVSKTRCMLVNVLAKKKKASKK